MKGFVWIRHSVTKQVIICIQADGGHFEHSVFFDWYSVGTCSVVQHDSMQLIHELQVSAIVIIDNLIFLSGCDLRINEPSCLLK
jgi:hypothetical protein